MSNKTVEQVILEILFKEDVPLGSGTICNKLQNHQFDTSEATAGRILRELDTKDFTRREGYKGRIITDKGKLHLQELKRENQKILCSKKFTEVIKSDKKKDIIDLMIARRGIERETARLAAQNATEDQINAMYQILNKHYEYPYGDRGQEADVGFHSQIAKSSKNKVLETALDLLRQEGEFSLVLAQIRKRVGSQVVKDHWEIYHAIRKREPGKAENAMIEHIESLIEDVNIYWKY